MPFADKQRLRDYQRVWCRVRRLEWLAGKSCVECGSTKNLEVDHIEPGQKVSHRIWTWSPKRRAEELAKCQTLCHDCHLAKTLAETEVLRDSSGRVNGRRRVAEVAS